VPLILDGGPCEVGIESTVLDLSVSPAQILRPGMIHAESLSAVVGDLNARAEGSGQALRSPGLLLRHYSPRAKLLIWRPGEVPPRELGVEPNRVHLLAHTSGPVSAGFAQVCIMPREPAAFAKALYAELHRADEAGAKLILVQAVPDEPEWQGIADRLRRAAAP
jgi:L-threonylcarbamoyladenylate synthase